MVSSVLVGAPTADPYEYCLEEYAKRAKELSYPNYKVVLADNSTGDNYAELIRKNGLGVVRDIRMEDSRERLAHSRNVLRKMVLDENFDYFLSLEQDVIPPMEVIERLMRHKKEIVTGVYFKLINLRYVSGGKDVRRVKKMVPLIFKDVPGVKGKMHFCTSDDVAGERLFKVRFCGVGCILISRKVLEKIEFRADTNVRCHDDYWFCHDARAAGFEIFCDTSVKCKHMLTQKDKTLFKEFGKAFDPGEIEKA